MSQVVPPGLVQPYFPPQARPQALEKVYSIVSPEAIDRLAERINDALPKFVPAFPSILLGLMVMIVMIVLVTISSLSDKKSQEKSSNFFNQSRWMLYLIGGTLVAFKVADFVQEKHYTINCIKTNRQHYANLHWLKLYRRSWKDAGSV